MTLVRATAIGPKRLPKILRPAKGSKFAQGVPFGNFSQALGNFLCPTSGHTDFFK